MTDLRASALARSVARVSVQEILSEDEQSNHDVEGIVTDLVAQGLNMHDMGTIEIAQFIAPHEFDEKGLTDAALAAAMKRSRTGWLAMIRRPDGDIQQLSLKQGAPDQKESDVENTLREFINFPEGTVISIFPLVG